MATFFMFGKYSSSETLKEISPRRTEKAVSLINKLGGEVQSMYALLGDKDLVLILTFPSIEKAIQASIALGKLTGISFTTMPAITAEEFDKLMTEI